MFSAEKLSIRCTVCHNAPGYKPELFREFTGSTLQPQGQAHNSPFASGDPDVRLIWMCAGNRIVSLFDTF